MVKYGERSTIHGVADLTTTSSRCMRMFWAMVLTTCLSVMLYNLGNLSYRFYQTPMSTTVKTILVNEFPQMAFCPQGVVGYAEDVAAQGLTSDDIFFLNGYFFISLARYSAKNGSKTPELSVIVELSRNITISVVSVVGNIPVSVKAVEKNLSTTIHGVCFVVHLNETARHGNIPEPVTLLIPSFQHILPLPINFQYTHGVVYFGDEVNNFVPTMPTYIADGRVNYVLFKETRSIYKDTWREPCIHETPAQITSRIFDCFDKCTLDSEGCIFTRNVVGNASTTKPSLCHWSTVTFFNAVHECLEACKRKTVSYHDIRCIQYQIETETRDVPSYGHFDNQTTIILQPKFATSLIFSETEVYTWSVFISNFGGICSLLCGASVISLVQLITFAIWNIRQRMPRDIKLRKTGAAKMEVGDVNGGLPHEESMEMFSDNCLQSSRSQEWRSSNGPVNLIRCTFYED